jgi:hypothetical protein
MAIGAKERRRSMPLKEVQDKVLTLFDGINTKTDLILYKRPLGLGENNGESQYKPDTVVLRRWSYRLKKYGTDRAAVENIAIPIDKIPELMDALEKIHDDYKIANQDAVRRERLAA